MSNIEQFIIYSLFISSIIYLIYFSTIVIFQRKFLFQTISFGYSGSDATPNLQASHFFLTTNDGERLDAVWLPNANAESVTILYLHGNAANLRCREGRLKAMADLGYSLLAIDWRGYGSSTGRPSQNGLRLDAEAAYGWLAQRTDPSRIVVFAESIGTGIGVRLAGEHKLGALVLEAPYFSALDLVEKCLPFVPVRALMLDPLRSDLWIRDIRTNLLIQHGRRDRLIPFSQGERLYEIAPEPKRMIAYPLGHHDDLPEKHNSYQDLKEFITDCFPID